MDEAQTVHGPVWIPGLGWEVRLYFADEEASQGFAVFAANGFIAHQNTPSPVVRWVSAAGAEPAGPLPPVAMMIIHGVDIAGRDGVVEIRYTALT
jgi:hypothetical protein